MKTFDAVSHHADPSMRSPVVLENIRVASPCPANWEKMTGDDRVRYCQECNLPCLQPVGDDAPRGRTFNRQPRRQALRALLSSS
jgi:hypothetical protein